MSSTAARRFKRQKERDIRKGKVEQYYKIPTKEDVEEYILEKKNEADNRLKDLGDNDFDNLDEFFINPVTPVTIDTFPHKELMEWKNEEHIKLMKNEQVK